MLKVAMIDRNHFIDRRIILEANLLNNNNYDVQLHATYGVIGKNESQIGQLKINRIAETQIEQNEIVFSTIANEEDIDDSIQLYEQKLKQLNLKMSESRFHSIHSSLFKLFPQKISMFFASLFAPKFASYKLLNSEISNFVKLIGFIILNLISFNFLALINIKNIFKETNVPKVKLTNTLDQIAYLKTKIQSLQYKKIVNENSKASILFNYTRYPLAGLISTREFNWGPGYKLLFRAYLILVSRSLYVYKNIFPYIVGKIPFYPQIPDYLKNVSQDLTNLVLNNPLDFWELETYKTVFDSNPNVVHVHDLPALKIGVLLSQNLNIPLIYDAHELYCHQIGIEGRRKQMLVALEGGLIKYCNWIVLINDGMAQIMRNDYGVDKFVVLTNATEIPDNFDMRVKGTIARDRLNIPENEKILMFMGGINKGRKIDLLFQGVAKSKIKTHLVLFTWGMEIPYFKDLAKKLKIENRIHFMEPIDWEQIIIWASSVDIGFIPYQADGLNALICEPNKMYEFIAAGTPIIGSSDLVNLKRVIDENQFGYITDLVKISDYSDALDKVFGDNDKLINKYRLNLQKYSNNFSFKVLSKNFLNMYLNLPLKRD